MCSFFCDYLNKKYELPCLTARPPLILLLPNLIQIPRQRHISHINRCLSGKILRVNVSQWCDEHLSSLLLTPVSRSMKWCPPIVVLLIHISSSRKQKTQDPGVTLGSGYMERCSSCPRMWSIHLRSITSQPHLSILQHHLLFPRTSFLTINRLLVNMLLQKIFHTIGRREINWKLPIATDQRQISSTLN